MLFTFYHHSIAIKDLAWRKIVIYEIPFYSVPYFCTELKDFCMTSKDCRTNAYVCAKQLCECAEGYKHDEKNKTCIGGEYQFFPPASYSSSFTSSFIFHFFFTLLIFIFSCYFYALCFYSKLLYIFNSTRCIFTVINNLKFVWKKS